MAPVLESVLGSLTAEYEKRLLAKEHELKASQRDVKAAQAACKQVQMELYDAHKAQAVNANALPVCEAQPGTDPWLPRPLFDPSWSTDNRQAKR